MAHRGAMVKGDHDTDVSSGKMYHLFDGSVTFNCTSCTKKYKQFGRLKGHVLSKHKCDLFLKCSSCGQDTFVDVTAFKRHTKGQKCKF